MILMPTVKHNPSKISLYIFLCITVNLAVTLYVLEIGQQSVSQSQLF